MSIREQLSGRIGSAEEMLRNVAGALELFGNREFIEDNDGANRLAVEMALDLLVQDMRLPYHTQAHVFARCDGHPDCSDMKDALSVMAISDDHLTVGDTSQFLRLGVLDSTETRKVCSGRTQSLGREGSLKEIYRG